MKKLLFLTAVLLQSFLAHSQEAESRGSYADLTVIPHLEVVPNYDFSGKKLGASWGNSSIYTLFEGAFSENVSWTVENHWLSLSYLEDIAWPYKRLGYSSTTNWLDIFKVDFTFGNWTFSLGKEGAKLGSYDYDEWDWDIAANMASPLWNNISSYQWGGAVAYTTDDEGSTFLLQIQTSPCGEHPFSSGLYIFTGNWTAQYGWFDCKWSISAVQYDRRAYTGLVALAQRATFGDFRIAFEYDNFMGNESGVSFGDSFKRGTYMPSVAYTVSDKWNFSARAVFTPYYNNFGMLANWYPLNDSDALRVHASLDYSTEVNQLSLCLGIRYNLCFHLWEK